MLREIWLLIFALLSGVVVGGLYAAMGRMLFPLFQTGGVIVAAICCWVGYRDDAAEKKQAARIVFGCCYGLVGVFVYGMASLAIILNTVGS